MSKSTNKLPTWRITRIKSTPAVSNGSVEAPDAETATREAIKRYGITDAEKQKACGIPGCVMRAMEAPMNDNEAEERARGRTISAALIGLALAGAVLFSALMAFVTVNSPPTTVAKRNPPATTGTAPSNR